MAPFAAPVIAGAFALTGAALLFVAIRSRRLPAENPIPAEEYHRMVTPPAPQPTYFVDAFAPCVYSRKDDAFFRGYSRMSDARRGAARLNAKEASS